MYEKLDFESFEEFKNSQIYKMLTDICVNLSTYMRFDCMDQLGMKGKYNKYLGEYKEALADVRYCSSEYNTWKRYDAMGAEALHKYNKSVKKVGRIENQYRESIKLGNNKIDISSRSNYLVEISITSDSLLAGFLVDGFFRKEFSIIFSANDTVFGIDLDKVPELVEINNQLTAKIKELQDSELYEKDKESVLKEMNSKSFKDRLKDICSALRELE